MIQKDLTFAFRNLKRNKLLAAINVLGLTIGISACLVIFLIASYEMSFDRFQPDEDRIYRFYSTFSGVYSGVNRGVPTAVPVAVRDNFTGIESATAFETFSGEINVPDGKGNLNDLGNYGKIVITDPDYFKVFNYYEWIAGNPEQCLTEPFKVVITESRAKIYFGELKPLDVVGKEIHYRDSLYVTVSGIVKDITERTDFDFTDFISYSTIEKSWLANNNSPNSWNSTNSSHQFFVKLMTGTEAAKIEAQIPELEKVFKQKSQNDKAKWSNSQKIQPLSELHFNPVLGIFDNSRSVVEKSTLETLVIIAALLLIIASINFINLETAQASRRAKEVGVRKVLGSSRFKLVAQFMVESVILCVLSVVLSVGLVALSLRYFSDFVPQGLTFDITDPLIAIFLFGCVFVVSLMAGLYPAFVLSSYQPALALKNLAHSNSATSRSAFIRKGLTVFQFSIAQVLIIGTIAIGLQLEYMLNKDLGFETDAIVVVYSPWWQKQEKRMVFKNELEQIPEIETIGMGAPPSSRGSSSTTMEFDTGKEKLSHDVYIKQGDTSYISLYKIKLLAGRNFYPKHDTVREYVINETYMKLLGFTDPNDVVGKVIGRHAVVGVVKDFHTQSLRSEIKPTVLYYTHNPSTFGIRLLTPNNKVADLKPAMEKIEAAWKRVYPDEKFDHTFLDDAIKNFYETEKRSGKLARTATGITIFISCLGLFGLSSFTVIQRTKEIGIRKVLGASVNGIMFLLSRDFIKLVIVACILSAPVAYYVADWWLKDFAYRMDLTVWIFVFSAVVSLLLAFFTISFRTVNAAKADPVKSLRYE